nr:hydrogen gas-evolving membrane-bound hydrogenase subunit E [Phytoactinopolyspora mesophila]
MAVAACVLFLPRRATAVVLFLVFGVLLAIVWARLDAPDIALAEAILGGGVTGALLIDAVAVGRRAADERSEGPAGAARWLVPIAGGAAGAVIAVVLAAAVLALDTPGIRLTDDVRDNIATTGVEHPVTAVLLNFRSYDTLLEVAVLAIAAIGVLGLRRDAPAWSDAWTKAAPIAIDGLVRVLTPVIVLLAGWLLVAGTTRPGGAFQAGALAGAGLILLYLGGRTGVIPVGRGLTPALMLGLAGFVGVAFGTALGGDGWLVLDVAWAGSVIIAIEVVVTLSIAAGLAVIFVANREPVDTETAGGGPTDVSGEDAR